MGKKALESGISHAGEKIGKKAAEKAGDVITKKLGSDKNMSFTPTVSIPASSTSNESTYATLNRLISGEGLKIKRKR